MRIVSINAGGGSPRRRTISLDDGAEPVVTARSVVTALDLAPDMTFPSRDALSAAVAQAETSAAAERAFDVLSRRDRSVAELDRALLADGYSATAVGTTLSRIAELGYLDDYAYGVRMWRSRAAAGIGSRRIASDLRQRGLDAATIAAVEQEINDGGDLPSEYDRARDWITRWGGTPSDRKDRDRMVRKLVARGYSLDVAIRAVGASDLDDSE